MDEDQKKRVAVFRFGVISDFFARDYVECGERERLLRDKCAQRWQAPSSSAPGCRAPLFWDGTGSIARAVAG
ncbi:hypothetical protein DFAR_570020 [Desulfarculales bacterium]